jgi:DNA-binding Lrp family transcriptional regulator
LLTPIHRGVYIVAGANQGALTRWMAAVLACRPGAVLSHLSAAALWGLVKDLREDAAPPTVTVLVRRAGLPEPEVNVRVRGLEVDFLWRASRVIVEIDGYAYHGHAVAFRRDRERTNALQLDRYRVLRFTWWHLVNDAAEVVGRLRRAVAGARLREPRAAQGGVAVEVELGAAEPAVDHRPDCGPRG